MREFVSIDGELVAYKLPINFRLGDVLRGMVNRRATQIGISRNEWIVRAAEQQLDEGGPARALLTAEMLLARRRTMMVRMDPLLVETIDEDAQQRGVKRTVWLMDACLSALARNNIQAEL